MKKRVLFLFILTFFVILVGCTISDKAAKTTDGTLDTPPGENWLDIPFVDVKTGGNFTIADFAGKPVLLEVFAVWCPVCLKQQQEIKKLHTKLGDQFVSISLDTDPNENKQIILEHVIKNDFNWFFSVSPEKLTLALIDNFGTSITDVTGAPVILVCSNQSQRLLSRGVKTAEKLKQEMERGCEKEAMGEKQAVVGKAQAEGIKPSQLINGMTVEERVQKAYDHLHDPNSALEVKKNFPDLVLVYTDDGDPYLPKEILPFQYFYSAEADKTFNLCQVDRSVFICKGKLDRKIGDEDFNSGRCLATPVYKFTSNKK